MTPEEVHRSRDRLQLLDVREDHEWDAGHPEGAVHIPMAQVPDRMDEVAHDRDVVVICRSGNRSDRVAAFLRDRGYRAENMVGGLLEWEDSGLPLVAAGGGEGAVF